MSDEVDLLRRIAAIEQRLGQIYDQVYCTYVPLTTALSEAGGDLAGAALNVGTYTVGPVGGGATYSFNYPTTAKALVAHQIPIWAAASGASFSYLTPEGGGAPITGCISRALVAGYIIDGLGIVALDGSGIFQIVVGGANTTDYTLRVIGYFL